MNDCHSHVRKDKLKTMKTKTDFVNSDTKKNLLSLFIPLMFAMILTMVYSIVDGLWVGNMLAENGISALTASSAIILILNSLAMGAGNGVTVLLAQLVGAGEKEKIKGAAAVVVIVSAIFSCVILLLGELTAAPLLIAMNTPAEVLPEAVAYLRICLLGNVALYFYMQFTSMFRAFGDSMFQMKGMLVTVIVNAVLDPIMIKVLGFNGVAIATVLSEVLCLLYALIYHRKKKYFELDFGKMNSEYAKEMLRLCIPTIIQGIMPAVSSAVMITFVNLYGVTALAGYGIARNLELIMFMPTNAMSMSITSISGQCHGAGRKDRAKDYLKFGVAVGSLLAALLSVIVIVFCSFFCGLFGQGSDVIEIVKGFFRILSIGYVLYMITSCIQGYITGMGKVCSSMVLLIMYYLVIRIPAAYFLQIKSGLQGVWQGFLISHILAVILAFLLMWKEEKRGTGNMNFN